MTVVVGSCRLGFCFLYSHFDLPMLGKSGIFSLFTCPPFPSAVQFASSFRFPCFVIYTVNELMRMVVVQR